MGLSVSLNLSNPLALPQGDAVTLAFRYDTGLQGTVVDVFGEPLPGRKVHVYERATGDRVATVETDADGAWIWTSADADPAAEYFVVAIDPDPEAQDYAPSAANRLQPVTIQ